MFYFQVILIGFIVTFMNLTVSLVNLTKGLLEKKFFMIILGSERTSKVYQN